MSRPLTPEHSFRNHRVDEPKASFARSLTSVIQAGGFNAQSVLATNSFGVDAFGPTGVDLKSLGRRIPGAPLSASSLLSDGFEKARVGTRSTVKQLGDGADVLMRLVPGQVRLFRWRATRMLRDAKTLREASPYSLARLMLLTTESTDRRLFVARLLRKLVPLASFLVLTGACGLVGQDGSGGESFLAPMPELSKSKRADDKGRTAAPWAYVLPVDHGVRADKSGKGHFRAPRFHGEHNGLDLLAPVGTPLLSACDGEAMAGGSRSFGRWVHVICPVPAAYSKKGEPQPWASFFYAHLSKIDLPHNEWVNVKRGQPVGAVGKSGNATGPSVQPHVHLELIVQKNHRAAMDEGHLGSDQSSVPAAEYFAESLERECLEPSGFRPRSRQLQRARRLDPFVALTCLSDQKPDFVPADKPLDFASRAWDHFYVAERFNVNRGMEDGRVAHR